MYTPAMHVREFRYVLKPFKLAIFSIQFVDKDNLLDSEDIFKVKISDTNGSCFKGKNTN